MTVPCLPVRHVRCGTTPMGRSDEGQGGRGRTDPKVGSRLSLCVLGKTVARVGAREVMFPSRKCRALLGYLAFSDAGEDSRERLVGLLWSENDEERARGSLRQTLHQVRNALEEAGFDGLRTDKLSIAIDRTHLDLDFSAVLEDVKAGRTHPLLLETERLIDSLMVEFETIDPAFRVWLLAKRQALHERVVRHLEQALQEARTRAGAESDLARALLNLDPTHEEAVRALMRRRAEAGDIAGALALYKKLWDLLEEEYDVEPSKETQELVAAIKMAQPEPGQKAGQTGPSAAQQIVVSAPPTEGQIILPGERGVQNAQPPKLIVGVAAFDGAGIPPDRVYLVQGFRRELIANLVRFREWAVRDGSLTAHQPRQNNGYEYLLEASAVKGTQEVRLIITLRNTQLDEFVWSDQYRLTLSNWTESQQHLVQRIAAALNVYLSAGRLASISHRPNPYLKAYDRWLFGQSRLHAWDPEAFHEATDVFQAIIAETPNFSPAYSTLAQLQNIVHFTHPGVFREQVRTTQALDYARAATRLDPLDSRGQLSLGWAYAMAGQHDLAETHHDLAASLNENDPWTATSVALGQATRGQLDAARIAAEAALAKTLSAGPAHWGYHEQIRFMTGDYTGTIDAAEQAGDVIPTSPAWKIAALGHLGHRADAQAEARQYLQRIRNTWFGDQPPTDENIARWTMHCFPIKRAKDWAHFRDGLAEGDLPVAELRHDKW